MKEILEGIRKLVFTPSPYIKDTGNGTRRESSVDEVLRPAPLREVAVDKANGNGEDIIGGATENGHGSASLEGNGPENNFAVVDEPQVHQQSEVSDDLVHSQDQAS